eukprot:CAMPEP_0179112590 /NCGR_PEP_ID=MMETSP0796-20121207/52637_1 /TAXON_ID=73915 /ORGANISM="Pyrodinium bahamense, Strain pbaha01" /LENGTH=281 /DNA_ID=CAMNT_0020810763 /DNA_START=44 /DNA_END=889 /DNA_ORIENTATION=-
MANGSSSDSALAEVDVEYQVVMISGKSSTLSCSSRSTLGSLHGRIIEVLGMRSAGETPPQLRLLLDLSAGTTGSSIEQTECPFCSECASNEDSAACAMRAEWTECERGTGSFLHDDTQAAVIAGGLVHVVVMPPEPEWCSGKRFKQSYLRGRRCGLEETSEDICLDLKLGGLFTYSRHDHEHDAECHYFHDVYVRASGKWTFSPCEADTEDGVIKLKGQASVCESSSRRRQSKELTEPFSMVLHKKELLGGGKGGRGGWSVQSVPEVGAELHSGRMCGASR